MQTNEEQQPIYYLDDQLWFPPVDHANDEGLLAVGGDLSPERLLLAYKSGIFPWFNEDALILWWSPDPRMVLFPKEIKVSKSMRKVLRNSSFELTKNKAFEQVIDNCAQLERKGQEGTWITPKMKAAYLDLHQKGFAVSYEVWQAKDLVGGLYGIDLGRVFCGESMFSLVSNASKYAFIHLAKELETKDYKLIDCQVYTEHLASLGAIEIDRTVFMSYLKG
ncbi:leucyl/phenylalanyl-tRNA--protein transferase [Croceivirga radicis]|uniref:leucyl/phenylalanyl-tRNA--protein transferase n=1 Tax=Croceivirga radicis TaxID=1929488 RepID=UPI0009B23312|nr:leucyl/phenylalanyl-tRNA--protein transferase [Croceivirga radicis]